MESSVYEVSDSWWHGCVTIGVRDDDSPDGLQLIVENVATLMDPPTVDETEANPFTMEEAKAFLEATAKRPILHEVARRSTHRLPTGRNGLHRPYMDLESDLFHPQWQLQRLMWRPMAARTLTPAVHAWQGHKAVFTRPDGPSPRPPDGLGRVQGTTRRTESMTDASTTAAAIPPARS